MGNVSSRGLKSGYTSIKDESSPEKYIGHELDGLESESITDYDQEP